MRYSLDIPSKWQTMVEFLNEDLYIFYDSREKRLAKKYYDKLFKEYCIADLSRYKENKVCLPNTYKKRFLFKYSVTFLLSCPRLFF